MASKNDITGDELKSKTSNESYRNGWERIFGNRDKKDNTESTTNVEPESKTNDSSVKST